MSNKGSLMGRKNIPEVIIQHQLLAQPRQVWHLHLLQ
jgi:hypothetical protein